MTPQETPTILPPLLPPVPSSRPPRSRIRSPRLDRIEDVDMYRKGGFHPVNLGDVLGEKYRVIHKLGNGAFAVVWLAQVLGEQRYVALKVLRADYRESGREVEILTRLRGHGDSHLGIAHLHESFEITGPNGVHQCLVLDPAGPSLISMMVYASHHLDSTMLKSAAQKLARSLARLHAHAICHGDLTHSNVLFEIKDLPRWTEDEVYQHLGHPSTAPLLRHDGLPAASFAPMHAVDAIDPACFDSALLSDNLLISDFGEAFYTANPPLGLGTPASFFGPEMLFQYPSSPAADLWALGCLIFEMHTLKTLAPTGFGIVEEGLAMAIETLGALPETWLDRWHDKEYPLPPAPEGLGHRWFDEAHERTRVLEKQLRDTMPDLPQCHLDTLAELLGGILRFEPSQRLSAAEVAQHPWFTVQRIVWSMKCWSGNSRKANPQLEEKVNDDYFV